MQVLFRCGPEDAVEYARGIPQYVLDEVVDDDAQKDTSYGIACLVVSYIQQGKSFNDLPVQLVDLALAKPQDPDIWKAFIAIGAPESIIDELDPDNDTIVVELGPVG